MPAAILRMGDPRLLRRARAVERFGTVELRALVDTLWRTMAEAGGVGLAAPQIGEDLRVVVFGFEHSERYPEAGPVQPTVLINPVLEPLGDDEEGGWEGCLSVPGMRGWVPRWKRLRYAGQDVDGRFFERVVDGFHARVVQHECDHLDGILYPMRIRDLSRFGFTDVLFPAGGAPADD